MKKIKNYDAIIKNVIIFLIMFGLFTIALFSFYPGILTIDGSTQWNQVEANYLRNNHPFFSTFIWWVLSKLWNQCTVLVILQMLIITSIWTGICSLLRNDKNFKHEIIYTIILCFIPIVFMYTITMWKDIIYTYMLLLLVVMLYIGIRKNFKYSYWNLFAINLVMALIILYRYNGIIVVMLSMITLLIIFLKQKYGIKKILLSFLMFIVIFSTLKIPEKIMCHPVSGSASYDVLFFSFAPLVIADKIDNEDDLELINQIYPIDKLKEEYNDYLINSMGTSKYYNQELYSKHYKDIAKMFIKYSFKHPITIIRHYLKSDNLLIGIIPDKDKSYIYIYNFTNWQENNCNFEGLVNPKISLGYKIYLKIINMTLTNKIIKLLHMPGNILYLSIILMIIFCKRIKDKRYFILLLPMIYNTLSLSLINLAQDLRYVYINYITLLFIVIPLLILKKVDKKDKIKNIKTKKNEKVIVIIPAYNEALNIEKTVKDVTENTKYDYIVVNDCSRDNTLEVCNKNKFNVVSLPVNFGLTSAIQIGMKYAYENDYDIAIQFDGDGQHQAKYLEDLVKSIEKNDCNVAIGSRFVDEKKPHTLRMLGNTLISWCIKVVTGEKINDTTSGMRAYDKNAIYEFVTNSSLTPEPDTLVYMINRGLKIKEIQVEIKDREFGESYLKPLKVIEYMLNMIFSILFIRK